MSDNRTLIKKIIEFDSAERFGYSFTGGYPDDMVMYGVGRRSNYDYGWHKPEQFVNEYPDLGRFSGFVRKDEYGNMWGKMIKDPSPQGEVLYGVLTDWDVLDSYQFPNISDSRRCESIKELLDKNPGKYRVGLLPGFPFSIMRYMRKMENFLADILLEQKRVTQLNDIVVRELLGLIDNFADVGSDAIMFCEDWGTQDRLLISPTLWREMFKPSFKLLCERAHARNMHVIMHSCGYIYEILEDLIEVGINVFQFDQPTLMGIDRISEMFHKRVSLFSSVNIQTTLPTGDKELIENEARLLVDKFFRDGGGFIARDYGDYDTIEVENEWVCWMREEFLRYGMKK